jgi:hypothetical protein
MKKSLVTYRIIIAVLLITVIVVFVKFDEIKRYYFTSTSEEYISVSTISESCLNCHINTKGYSDYHNPELIGCTGCHLGNGAETDKDKSHEGMILIPGNLSDAQETCGKCHPNELHKVQNSLMTTNSGLVAVDKFIFDEADSPDYHYHITQIKNSASDKHLRDLCANCHLGAQKSEFGAIDELSRGGGCNACHLNYSKAALNDLDNYLTSNKTQLPQFHPSTDIFVDNPIVLVVTAGQAEFQLTMRAGRKPY